MVDAGVELGDCLARIDGETLVHEIDRGQDFDQLLAEGLHHFGQVVDLMKFTVNRRDETGTGAHTVDELVAASRGITARLTANEAGASLVFSIYRHSVSLFDYVQVAVQLPGLAVYRHPDKPQFFLAASESN